MTTRAQLEKAAQQIAHLSKVLLPGDCSFCVLAWGPDVKGQQWSTYVHNTEPAGGGVRGPVEMHHKAEARRNLAQELRRMADVIESRADLPRGWLAMDDILRLLTLLTTAVCGVYVIAVILRLRRQCRDLAAAQRRWKELALEKNVSPDLEVVATEALVKELFRRSPAIILLTETKEGYKVQIYAHHMQVAQGVATRALEIMQGNDQ